MTVLPVIVLKCTKWTVPNIYLSLLKKGIFYSSVDNDKVLVTTVEDKIKKYTVREYLKAIIM